MSSTSHVVTHQNSCVSVLHDVQGNALMLCIVTYWFLLAVQDVCSKVALSECN